MKFGLCRAPEKGVWLLISLCEFPKGKKRGMESDEPEGGGKGGDGYRKICFSPRGG